MAHLEMISSPRDSGSPFYDQALIVSALLLAIWSTFSAIANNKTYDAITSSIRILSEVSVFFYLSRSYNLRDGFEKLIIFFSVTNSVVVLIQIMEQMDIVGTGFSELPMYFYGVEIEYFRKPGLLNGFQTSSLLSFVAIVLIMPRLNSAIIGRVALYFAAIINVIPIFFGARVFLILLPFLFVSNKRMFSILLLSVPVLFAYSDFVGGEFGQYFEERVVPAFQVVYGGNASADYSAADTISHYRAPQTPGELIFGNGAPRYPTGEGGGDPTVSRWLLQAGFPAALLIVVISGLIILRLGLQAGVSYKILAAALVLATFKGELVTAAGIVFLLLSLSQKRQSKPFGS